MRTNILLVALGFFVSGCLGDDGANLISFEDQLVMDVELIDEYLAANDIETEIHSSGIRFIQNNEGDGDSPEFGDVAIIKFEFSVIGTEEPFLVAEYGESVTLNQSLFLSFQLMLPDMKVGDNVTMYAPSGYCYGTRSTTTLPANSNLKIELELMDVVTNAEEQFTADTTIIENYLMANEIDAKVHESGIRYTVQVEGEGESPESTDNVVAAYVGEFLNGDVFDESSEDGVQFNLNQVIEAWRIMVPTMKSGGSITIYAPSKLCYGTTGNQSIPPNTILIFEVELLEIVEE